MATKKKAAKKKTAAKVAGKPKNADIKTRPTTLSVDAFIAKVANEKRRKDAGAALALMKKATGLSPKMWGPSIIGFGSYHYKYESGREGDMCLTGFSPRAAAMVFYLLGCAPEKNPLFQKLGKFKASKSCIYVNKLDDIDLAVLEKIIIGAVAHMRKTYPTTD